MKEPNDCQIILTVVSMIMIFLVGMATCIRIIEKGIPSIEDIARWLRSLRTAPKRFWQVFTEREPEPKPKPRSAVGDE